MLKRNIFLFKFYYFFWRFKPLAALMIIYFSQITHSYAAAMMIFSIFNIFYAFAKIPCGMLSDKIGRKPILIMANFFMTIAFFLLAVSGQYKIEQFLYIFAVLWALGEAMAAGTVEALMYETSQSLGYSDKFYLIYSKSMVFDQLGCAFGAFWAMTITYFLPLQFVAWLSVFPSVMQLIVSYFFIEPDVKKNKISLTFKDIVPALQQFKENKKLLFYSCADIYFSTLGDVSHRFESAYFKLFASDWLISLARMLKHFCGMTGFLINPYRFAISKAQVFFGSIISNMFVRSMALAFNNIYTPFIHMFINFFYATASTAKTDIMQQEYLPQYRATSQSIIQFIKGIYMAGIMYIIGLFADTYSIYAAMVLLVLLRIIGLGLAYVLHRYLL